MPIRLSFPRDVRFPSIFLTKTPERLIAVVGMLFVGLLAQAHAKPLKVFILAGQSNMQGMAAVSTMEHIGMDPKTAPMLEDMRTSDGKPVVLDDVYISYLTGSGGRRNGKGEDLEPIEKFGKLTAGVGDESSNPRFGPEYTFGIYMHKKLQEPFLIIKTAWGGRSLHRDFRPPGSIPESLKPENLDQATDEKTRNDIAETGLFYRQMLEHVRNVLTNPEKYHPAYDPAEGFEIAGLVWFQGFNDMVDNGAYPNRTKEGGYDLYTELLAQMIRDFRSDLLVSSLPVVIGVVGMDGPVTPESEAKRSPRYRGIVPNFRKAQAAVADLPEFKDTVTAVHTDQFWDAQLHELDTRNGEILRKIEALKKEGKLSRAELREMEKKWIDEAFTEEERKIFLTGRSSQSFHYLGSAKIYGQIGKAFAEAMTDLLK